MLDTNCSTPSCSSEAELPGGLSRRDLLRVGAAGAATLAASQFGLGQTYPGGDGQVDSQAFMDAQPFIPGKTYALVDRLTYGINDFEMAQFDKLGWAGYLEYQLAATAIDDSACTNRLLEYPSINATVFQALHYYTPELGYQVFNELSQAQIVKQLYTQRQLQEVMTEFWLDHFCIYAPAIWTQFLPQYVRLIRNNALGKFETLLSAVAHSGAMLFYLNNIVNDRVNRNENFARELLELHSLGAYQGYTEADIYVVRRCLTGWNFRGFYEGNWKNTTDPLFGSFQYNSDKHDNEGGYFMGTLIPKGEVEQGNKIISILANHPNTAKHICTKLIQKFVTETPSAAFVQAAANVFTSKGGDIKSVMRYIMGQSVFNANAKPKFKRPLNYTISAMRATNAYLLDPTDVLNLVIAPSKQLAFQWPAPNGYPDQYDKWVDNLLPRWKFAANMCSDGMWGVRIEPFYYMGDRTRDGVVAYINKALFGGSLPAARITALKNWLAVASPVNTKIRETIGLALALPDFHWY